MRVETLTGPISGIEDDDINAFLGIPYAQPPIGPLRFRPPKAIPPWNTVRMCEQVGPAPPQRQIPTDHIIGIRDLKQSEDCLNLNVWTPREAKKRPVLFWIYGGAFTMGSGAANLSNGAAIAREQDVVVVTFNYRLGFLGFFAIGELLGDNYREAANLGLLDTIAALRWVYQNIEVFGGDPERITVMGQSAGGTLAALAASHQEGKRYVRRYIVQSSGLHVVHDQARAEEIGLEALKLLQIEPTEVSKILELPTEKFLEVQDALGGKFIERMIGSDYIENGGMPIQPSIDGIVITKSPEDLVAEINPQVELLIGTTSNEMGLNALYWPDFAPKNGAQMRERFDGMFAALGPRKSAAALEVYRSTEPTGEDQSVWTGLQNDAWVAMPARRLANAHPGPVYGYIFDYQTDVMDGSLGAYHVSELPFLWDKLETEDGEALIGETGAAAQCLAKQVGAAWATFAATGMPGAIDLPEWPRWECPNPHVMLLGLESEVIMNPNERRHLVWDELDASENP